MSLSEFNNLSSEASADSIKAESGKPAELLQGYGLTAEDICQAVHAVVKRKFQAVIGSGADVNPGSLSLVKAFSLYQSLCLFPGTAR